MNYIMLVVAAMLLSADFAMNKFYQRLRGTSPKASLFFNSILGLSTAIIFFVANKFKISFTPYSVALSMMISILVMSYNIIGFRLLKMGSMAIYTLFLLTGAMILPYIWGLMFLDEPFSVMRTIGLFLIVAGVIFSNFSNEKINLKQIIMCVCVFILNGFGSIVSKMHQIEVNYECVNTFEFIMIGGLFRFFIAGILYLFFKNKNEQKTKNDGAFKMITIIITSAVFGGVSYFLQLFGAKSLPATVLYPFVTGGSIVFSALVSTFVFKEKISPKLVISVALCFAGTVLFI